MGISVEARFPDDGLFYAGDRFVCTLTFFHTPGGSGYNGGDVPLLSSGPSPDDFSSNDHHAPLVNTGGGGSAISRRASDMALAKRRSFLSLSSQSQTLTTATQDDNGRRVAKRESIASLSAAFGELMGFGRSFGPDQQWASRLQPPVKTLWSSGRSAGGVGGIGTIGTFSNVGASYAHQQYLKHQSSSVRKSMSMSALRTPSASASSPANSASSGVTKPSVVPSPPMEIISVRANQPKSDTDSQAAAPVNTKAPRLTAAPPPVATVPAQNSSSLTLVPATGTLKPRDISVPKRTPPVTPTNSQIKNPFSDIPIRSLSIDMSRPSLSDITLERHASAARDELSNEAHGSDSPPSTTEQQVTSGQQIFLSNVSKDMAGTFAIVEPLDRRQTLSTPYTLSSSPTPEPSMLSARSSVILSPQLITNADYFNPPLPVSGSQQLSENHGIAGAGTEQLAWGFAQMTGLITVDSTYIKTTSLEPLKARAMYDVGGTGPGGGGSMGVSALGLDNSTKPGEKSYPLYNTPPSILFYDMVLYPGESRSFTYEILLPSDLPPTHRGKVIRVSYKLVVGVQRGGVGDSGAVRRSQVIQLPFRMFGRVSEDGSISSYDILNPFIMHRDEAKVIALGTAEHDERNKPKLRRTAADPKAGDDDEKLTVLQRLVMVCQRSGKLSFDICKNNEHVAQLTLQRGSYRLGETITGVLNFSRSRVPCFQVSVFLENSETVEPPYNVRSREQTSRSTRRVFAEQHRYVVNMTRTGISLPIPVGCTPDFKTTAVSLSWVLRLEFITGVKPMLLKTTSSDENFVHMKVLPQAEVEAFDCILPLKVYPTKTARRAPPKVNDIL